MAQSTLIHTDEEEPVTDRGHGTRALGPSDTSDSGSDVVGGPGMADEAGRDVDPVDSHHEASIGLDTGTTSDVDAGRAGGTAGPDLGDPDLDGDSDSGGTGERRAATRDLTRAEGQDIGLDSVEDAEAAGASDEPGEGDERERRP